MTYWPDDACHRKQPTLREGVRQKCDWCPESGAGLAVWFSVTFETSKRPGATGRSPIDGRPACRGRRPCMCWSTGYGCSSTSRARKLVPDGPVDAGKADPAAASRRARFRSFDLPPRLFGAWQTSSRSSISITAATAEARTALPRAGIWRNGATTCARSAMRWASSVRLSWRVVRRHGRAGLRHAPSGPSLPADIDLSTEAAGGSYPEQRVALFERLGGPEVGALARRRFLETKGHPDQTSLDAWRRLAFPHYTRKPRDPDIARRAVSRPEVLQWFTRPGGESHTFNFLRDLHRIRCPTLVLGGEDDPIHPIESQADIAAAIPAHLVRFERFTNCGHAVIPDAPERAMAVIRDFIAYR